MRTIDVAKRSEQVKALVRKFEKRIVHQEEAVEKITNLLERYLGGLSDTSRPIGSALFLGPTGVGKTAVVEALCEGLYGDPQHMIKIDCAEFQHSHEIAKLIGSPPGYLGHRETPPRLTQTAIDNLRTEDVPFTVVLFDEIEKASDAMWHLMLGILDRGSLTLGDNTRTNFSRTILLMTSNVGSKEISVDGKLGFGYAEKITGKEITDKSLSAARSKFTPEFLNRLDEIVVFNSLERVHIEKIMHMECYKCKGKLAVKGGIVLVVSPAAFTALLDRGYDKKYNARGMRRTLEKEIMTPLARAISSGEVKWGEGVVMDYREGDFFFHITTILEHVNALNAEDSKSRVPAGQLPLPIL